MLSDTINKFFNSPGRCTQSELDTTKEFLTEYMRLRDVYRSTKGFDPEGLTLESNLETMDWYQNNPTKGKPNVR